MEDVVIKAEPIDPLLQDLEEDIALETNLDVPVGHSLVDGRELTTIAGAIC